MIAVATTDSEIDRLSALLESHDATLIEVLAPGGQRRVALAEATDGRDTERIARSLRDFGLMSVARPGSGAELSAWQRNTQPVVFSDRLSICLAWSEHDRDRLPNLIELGPGGFGSGHHATTRMIIEELVVQLGGGERVLDIGCGSGILALAAVALGASEAVGVDLKPEAVEATSRNALLNGMSRRVTATDISINEINETFDLVLANIARAGIVALADQLVGHVAPGGHLIVGGITLAQCEQVTGFLEPLIEVERRVDDGWAVLVLGRPSADRT